MRTGARVFWAADDGHIQNVLDTLIDAVQAAANEGRNVAPSASDDVASEIEQWAMKVLGKA